MEYDRAKLIWTGKCCNRIDWKPTRPVPEPEAAFVISSTTRERFVTRDLFLDHGIYLFNETSVALQSSRELVRQTTRLGYVPRFVYGYGFYLGSRFTDSLPATDTTRARFSLSQRQSFFACLAFIFSCISRVQ
ncbi:unnamed protein product [Amoebophrya sp. A120]|nr:unnamed protein product [Amoebophrya sp. A120]CAD7975321.1 unnamed protein product [Amoebophrya sp. A120]|eukprot:GSA120T00025313001.1